MDRADKGKKAAQTPATRPDTTHQRLERERSERQAYLQSAKGMGELHEALLQITDASAQTRMTGAKTLADPGCGNAEAKRAFSAILDAAEKEDCAPVMLAFAEAICDIAGQNMLGDDREWQAKNPDVVRRISELALDSKDADVAKKLAYALYHCIPGQKKEIYDGLVALMTKAKEKGGEGSPAFEGIQSAWLDMVADRML